MKKKVRIYKAGGQQGQYLNPTSQWMAQIGGQQQPQITDEQLLMTSLDMLSKGVTKEQLYSEMINSGIEATRISQIFQALERYSQEQQQMSQAAERGDQEQLQEMIQQDSQPMDMSQYYMDDMDTSDMDAEEDQFMQEQILERPEAQMQEAKKGGSKMSKTKWVNQQVKLAKKQMGGANKADDTGADVREQKIGSFVNTVKNNSDTAALKNYFENQYDTMNQYDEFEYLPEAQFGGLRPGQVRRMQRRANRMMRNIPIGFSGPMGYPGQVNLMTGSPMSFLPQMPMMFGAGPQLANIDVRRTGLFGRPKEYTMNFQNFNPHIMKNYEDLLEQIVRNQQAEAKENKVQNKKEEQDAVRDQNKKEADVETDYEDYIVKDEPTSTGGSGSGSGKGSGSGSGSGSGTTEPEAKVNPEGVPKMGSGKPYWDPLNPTNQFYEGPNYYDLLGSGPKQTEATPEKYWSEGSVDLDPKTGMPKRIRLELIDPKTNRKTGKYKILTGKELEQYRLDNMVGGATIDGYSTLTPEQLAAQQERIQNLGPLNITDQALDDMERARMTDPTLMAAPQAAMADDDFWQSFLIPGLKGTGPLKWFGQGVTKPFTPSTRMLGAGRSALGPGQTMLGAGQRVLNPGQRMLNAGQRMLNPPPGYQYALPFQAGGFVDPNSNLYKFVYGGNEPFIDYFADNSVNTADPYLKKKGGTKLEMYQSKGEVTDDTKVEILDDKGNVTGTTTLADAENRGLKHRVVANTTSTTTTSTNTGLSKEDMDAYMQQMLNMYNQQMYNQPSYTPGLRTGLRTLFPGLFRGRSRTPIVQNLGSWYKQKGLPYDMETGEAYTGNWMNPQLAAIDVKDRNLFGDKIRYEFLVDEPLAQYSTDPLKAQRAQSRQATRQDRREARQEARDNQLQTQAPFGARLTGWKGTRRPNRFNSEQFDVYNNNYNTLLAPETPQDLVLSEDELPNVQPEVVNYTEPQVTNNVNIPPGAPLNLNDFGTRMEEYQEYLDAVNNPNSKIDKAQLLRNIMEFEGGNKSVEDFNIYQRNLPLNIQKDLYGSVQYPDADPSLLGSSVFNSNFKRAYGGLHMAEDGLITPPISPEGYEDFAIGEEYQMPEAEDFSNLTYADVNEFTGDDSWEIDSLPLRSVEPTMSKLNPLNSEKKRRIGIDTKEKKTKSINTRELVNRGVPFLYGAASLVENWQDPTDMATLTNADNINPTDPIKDRRTFNFQTGEMPGRDFTGQGGAYSKYGGALDYRVGQDTYMSEKDIRDFLANGGEIEFI